MRHTLKSILIAFTSVFLVCCISTYDPPVVGNHGGLLVVEGIITEGETTIKLSRSVALSSDKSPFLQGVSGARVWIESENGERFEAVENSNSSNYVIQVSTLDEETRYRLRISYNGQEYESTYRRPQPTPPLEELDFHNNDHRIQVRLNVQGEPGGPRHYFWSYEETWEIHAALMQTHYFGSYEGDFGPSGVGYTFGDYTSGTVSSIWKYPGVAPFYYCWKYNDSQGLLLGNTELLTDNTVKNHVLYEFREDDDRLSFLYHTKVSQYALGSDAYFYYDNQRKNVEDTGSIFAPIPSEMQGNITCTSSPETPVIGFVEVSKRVQREAFRQPYGTSYPSAFCRPLTPEAVAEQIVNSGNLNLPYSIYPLRLDVPSADTLYTTLDCIDCRRQGGSKTRPDWWPNDHR